MIGPGKRWMERSCVLARTAWRCNFSCTNVVIKVSLAPGREKMSGGNIWNGFGIGPRQANWTWVFTIKKKIVPPPLKSSARFLRGSIYMKNELVKSLWGNLWGIIFRGFKNGWFLGTHKYLGSMVYVLKRKEKRLNNWDCSDKILESFWGGWTMGICKQKGWKFDI